MSFWLNSHLAILLFGTFKEAVLIHQYNKLVRDKLVSIIEGSISIKSVKYRTLEDDSEFFDELVKKLKEEIDEFFEEYKVEELADILEVVFAIAEQLGVSKTELEEIRQTKFNKRGGFEERIYLIEVEG